MGRRVRYVILRVFAILGGSALLAAASGYGGYVLGGHVGFMDGFAAGATTNDAINAVSTVVALRALHRGEQQPGVSTLEMTLDSATMSYWGYLHRGDSEFDRTGILAKSHRLMRQVAQYRLDHPPVAKDPEVLAAILEALACAREHQPAPSNKSVRADVCH